MDQSSGPNEKPLDKAEERVIRGAEAIAEFIFGDRSHPQGCTTSWNAPRSRSTDSEARFACGRQLTKAGIDSQENRAVMNAKHDA
jgi:hypothetical protein